MQQLGKHSSSAASMLHDLGAVSLLVGFIAKGVGNLVPACAALGHMVDASSDAADVAVEHGAVSALTGIISAQGSPVHVCAVAAGTVGSISNQSASGRAHIVEARTVQASAWLLAK